MAGYLRVDRMLDEQRVERLNRLTTVTRRRRGKGLAQLSAEQSQRVQVVSGYPHVQVRAVCDERAKRVQIAQVVPGRVRGIGGVHQPYRQLGVRGEIHSRSLPAGGYVREG